MPSLQRRAAVAPAMTDAAPAVTDAERGAPVAGRAGAQVRAVAGAFALRSGGLAVSLLVNVAVGRLLGAAGAGQYYLFVTWTNLLGTLVALGLPFVALRGVARLEHAGLPGAARHLALRGVRLALGAGALVVAGVLLLGTPLARLLLREAGAATLLGAAAVAGTLMAVMRVFAESLKARGRSGAGLTVEFTLVPSGILLVLAGAAALHRASVPTAFAGYVGASALACAVGAALLLPGWRGAGENAPLERGPLLRFWGVDLLTISLAYLPFVLLPHFATGAQVGEFGVAHRLVTLATIVQAVLASIFAPQFARLWASRDGAGLRRALGASQGFALGAYLPLFVIFLAAGGAVLGVFGPAFRGALPLLWIMSAAQLVNAATGLSGYLLYMTGHEHADLAGQGLALVVGAGIALALGPTLGAEGVAWGYAGAVTVRSAWAFVAARRVLARAPQAAPVLAPAS